MQNDGAKAIVDLGATLFQRWQAAGGRGENMHVLNGTEVQLLATPARFIGIPLEVGEDLPITMRVDAFKSALGAGTSREYHFSAQEFINGELVGGVDYAITTRAQDTDSDGDGIKDVVDTDNDNIDDEWEIQHGLNPLGQADAAADSDGDGLPNLEEYKIGTNPTNSTDASNDSDGDGVSNLEEYQAGTNPVDPASRPTEPKYTVSGKVFAEENMVLPGATVQIGDHTAVTDREGYWKIEGLPNGDYTAIVTKNGYTIPSRALKINGEDFGFDLGVVYVTHGTIKDKQKQPVAGVIIAVGDKQAQTDAAGNWRLEGLPVGELTAVASKEGYQFAPEKFMLSNQEPNKELLITPASSLVLKANPWAAVRQGETVTYTYTLFNGGDKTATGVSFVATVPAGAELVSLTSKEAGNCQTETLTCNLSDLSVGASTQVEVVLRATEGSVLKNKGTVNSNEYPTDVQTTRKTVKPHLSVTLTDDRDPVAMLSEARYTAAVELSPLSPTETAQDINLTLHFPAGLELKTVTSTLGDCDDSQFPVVTCNIPKLSIASPEAISRMRTHFFVKLDFSVYATKNSISPQPI